MKRLIIGLVAAAGIALGGIFGFGHNPSPHSPAVQAAFTPQPSQDDQVACGLDGPSGAIYQLGHLQPPADASVGADTITAVYDSETNTYTYDWDFTANLSGAGLGGIDFVRVETAVTQYGITFDDFATHDAFSGTGVPFIDLGNGHGEVIFCFNYAIDPPPTETPMPTDTPTATPTATPLFPGFAPYYACRNLSNGLLRDTTVSADSTPPNCGAGWTLEQILVKR